MVRIQVVVSDEQKSRWEAYSEDNPGVDSVSDLVRTSVEAHISSDGESGGDELNDTVDAVAGDLDRIESRLGDIEDQVRLARLENVESDELEEIVELVIDEYVMGLAEADGFEEGR